ncbi:MAG: PAS domain S-box protein, partial [Nitrospirota bacterium]|nr:PAS domain S-box protein [Nitrospirota bacterium]
MASFFLLFSFAIASPCFAAESPPAKNVLILYSFTKRENFYALEPLKSTIRSRVHAPVHFEVEYLESERFGMAGYEETLSALFRQVYGGEKFDLVITSAYPALRFAVNHRDRLFPGVPIVFIEVVADRLKDKKLPPGVTGVTVIEDAKGTLDLALRLHPDTKTVAVITGTSEFERFWQSAVHREFQRYADRVDLIDLAGLRTDELLRRVNALPAHTVVLFQLIPQDALQPVMGPMEILTAVSQKFPTYCIHNYCFDHGAVGGSYNLPNNEQGIKGGELGARVLAGEKPENIPVVHTSGTRPRVDWRQLQKWKISESALPPGTIVLYRQQTIWERYRNVILLCILVIVFQALLITGLLWQRARKRKSEASLSESEGRFKIMADTAPSLIWMCDKDGKVTYQSEKRTAFTGGTPESALGDGWTAHIHPGDLKSTL